LTPAAANAVAGAFSWEPTSRGAAPIDLLLQWQAEGLSYYAIARRIGRDPRTVQKRLERYAVQPEACQVDRHAEFAERVAALWARGMTQRQISQHIHACERRVRAVTKTLPKPQRHRKQTPTQHFLDKCEAFVALVKAGSTFYEARERVGIGKDVYRRLVLQHGLVSTRKPRPASAKPRREKAPPVERIARAKEAPPNPYRTEAQNAVIKLWKGEVGMVVRGRDTRSVPPPHNAEQLIADAIAAGRVTRCPPRAVLSVNQGLGFAPAPEVNR
jgi:DNA-binding CsgD family transcriptional regulator